MEMILAALSDHLDHSYGAISLAQELYSLGKTIGDLDIQLELLGHGRHVLTPSEIDICSIAKQFRRHERDNGIDTSYANSTTDNRQQRMDAQKILMAAELIYAARTSQRSISSLPQECKPTDMSEAMRIIGAVSSLVAEPIVGWKIAAKPESAHCWAPLFESRVFASPARIQPSLSNLRLVEGEISFRTLSDIPARQEPYAYEEVISAVEAFLTIEILTSHYSSVTRDNFRTMSQAELFADNMMSGAFVIGSMRLPWRGMDYSRLRFAFKQGDTIVGGLVGERMNLDPAVPVVLLANYLRHGIGLPAGTIVATGSFTGALPFQHGEEVAVEVEGMGSVTAIVDHR